jgi:HNH endonuclease
VTVDRCLPAGASRGVLRFAVVFISSEKASFHQRWERYVLAEMNRLCCIELTLNGIRHTTDSGRSKIRREAMATPLRDITNIRFEAKDVEIFRIPHIKTRLDTLQNYFFPRLELLLHNTVDLIQKVYSVTAYEQMTVTARPRHRKQAGRSLDTGVVYMGLTGKRSTDRPLIVQRQDGVPFFYHPSRLTYMVYPEGDLQVLFHPFTQLVDTPFQVAVAALLRDHCTALAPLLALYHIAHTCVVDGVFVDLSEAFSSKAITRATPSQALALASPPYHFPLETRMLLFLQEAFIILYPLLEACTAIAKGESHRLAERLDMFKRWYLKGGEANVETEPTALTSPEFVLPDLDSYTFIRAGLWWAVLARDRWTCCSCGRSTRQDGVLLEVDHILPRSQAGSNAMDNLQTLCHKCNAGKSNRGHTDLRREEAERVQGNG